MSACTYCGQTPPAAQPCVECPKPEPPPLGRLRIVAIDPNAGVVTVAPKPIEEPARFELGEPFDLTFNGDGLDFLREPQS